MKETLDSNVIAGLLGLLAHDLRNPLSALQSNVNYVGGAAAGADPDVREAIDDAVLSCESLGHVVENMELLAHGISDTQPRPPEPVELVPVVEEVVALHQGQASSHGARLALRPSPARSVRALAHRDPLRRALGNLLRNAIQYCPNGTVTVSLNDEGDRVGVVVADTGPGLDPSLCELAFAAAGQLTVKSAPGGRYGRGLGLYCARVAATLAGATVDPVEPPAGCNHAMALRVGKCP